ncbi:hypothetical protein ACJX0J_037068, partial [Zea mays]
MFPTLLMKKNSTCTTKFIWGGGGRGSEEDEYNNVALRATDFLAAGDRMQDAALTQQGRHMRTELFNSIYHQPSCLKPIFYIKPYLISKVSSSSCHANIMGGKQNWFSQVV